MIAIRQAARPVLLRRATWLSNVVALPLAMAFSIGEGEVFGRCDANERVRLKLDRAGIFHHMGSDY